MSKKLDRIRRSKRIRAKIKQLGINRLCVHRTPRHIYAQVIAPCGSKILASASSLDKETRVQLQYGGNVATATIVGKVLAERAIKAGVVKVAFDRSGFRYHGRVKALAESAREQGMEF